jgi:uncharacterized phage protein (TIGR02218 family)
MKNISAGLKTHLSEDCVTLTVCWRLRRRDGVQMGFTSHDEAVEVESFLYQSVTGFMPSNISSTNGFNVDNLDVKAFLSSAFIKEEDILIGLYDYAEVEVFQVNWQNPAMGKIELSKGILGEIQLNDHHFVAEIRGLNQKLQQMVGATFSPECRADFGNKACHAKLDEFQKVGKVTSLTAADIFTDVNLTEADDYYNYGNLRWISGNNSGLFSEIKGFSAGNVTLYDAMPHDIAIGDIYKVTAGCDKRSVTCKSKFNNFINFQGEVAIPGNDALFNYPGLK